MHKRRRVLGSIGCVVAIGAWGATVVACAGDDAPEPLERDPLGTVTQAATSDAGLPECTYPAITECADSCATIEDAERKYRRAPLEGKVSSYRSTKTFEILPLFGQTVRFDGVPSEISGAAQVTITALDLVEGGVKICKALPIVAELYTTGEAIYNLTSIASTQNNCTCVDRTPQRIYRWKVPTDSTACWRQRSCWDKYHKATTTERYPSKASFHNAEKMTEEWDGSYRNDDLVQKEGTCSIRNLDVVRTAPTGALWKPVYEVECGGFKAFYNITNMSFGSDNVETALMHETCVKWCASSSSGVAGPGGGGI